MSNFDEVNYWMSSSVLKAGRCIVRNQIIFIGLTADFLRTLEKYKSGSFRKTPMDGNLIWYLYLAHIIDPTKTSPHLVSMLRILSEFKICKNISA